MSDSEKILNDYLKGELKMLKDRYLLINYLINMDNYMDYYEQRRFIDDIQREYKNDSQILEICENILMNLNYKEQKRRDKYEEFGFKN